LDKQKLGVRCHVVENARGNFGPVEKTPARFKAGMIRDLVKNITHERKSAMGTVITKLETEHQYKDFTEDQWIELTSNTY